MATPIILYDNRFLDGTITATDTASGFSIMNIKDYRTYTFWKSASSGTKYITVDCLSAKSADCLGIIGHNLGTANAVVSVESSPDNTNWTVRLAGFTPTSNKAILKLFTIASARYWRVKIVTSTIQPQIAVIFLGNKLQFPYPPDVPYIPYIESVSVNKEVSKAGHIISSVIEFKSIEVNAKFSNLTRDFVINQFKPFWDNHASNFLPFFYAWDIDNFPEMVFYLTMSKSAKFQMPMTILQYIDSIELEMEGVKE